ncbi:ornithine decarboxylase isoform X1 [Dermacentor silvarum]|uniref:ornithine decarboxylase isoform X1 n=2 Tax=Dermacentor silvarum TaxID=543639 RepID=UPI0021018049|nr:ornithine decarboxylase isoform X1 [Dermacentor silvarum]
MVYEMDKTAGNSSTIHTEGSVVDVAQEVINCQEYDDAFFICDVRDLLSKVELWKRELPRVSPFYAIKACTDPVVLKLLKDSGVNFDCSNRREIATMLNLGTSPDRILYAQTVKNCSHLDYALEHGVDLMTFDSAEELDKIHQKDARLLLRIIGDEEGCHYTLNKKFGCLISDAPQLLKKARSLGRKVVGIAFHVGCAYQDPSIFVRTIEQARKIFDLATDMGFEMNVLDIGGGFPGGLRNKEKFLKVCASIRSALDAHFPSSNDVKILAEPGQFFVTSAYTLLLKVVGKRKRNLLIDGKVQEYQEVFLSESKRNCITNCIYDFLDVQFRPLDPPYDRPCNLLSTLWGATCSPLDCIADRQLFFDVKPDEWIVVDNMGAYSLVNACGFNGFGFPRVHYVVDPVDADRVRVILDALPVEGGYGPEVEIVKKRPSDNALKKNGLIQNGH